MKRLLAAALVASMCVPAAAAPVADIPYRILIGDRPMDSRNPSGLSRGGVTYVNVVRAVKTFDGLLTFGRGGTIRVTIGGRTMVFAVGRKTAVLDGTPIRLAGAPFVRFGDNYVPLAQLALLGHAKLYVDRRRREAILELGRGEGFAQPASPAPSDAADEDVQPSPAQALSFATSGTTDASGLHARVAISNGTPKPYTIGFPSSQQIAFIVVRNGAEIWNSAGSARDDVPSKLTIDPYATKTIVADWPAFVHAGPGRYTLRVRLLTLIPLDVAPVSLGVSTPGPSASS